MNKLHRYATDHNQKWCAQTSWTALCVAVSGDWESFKSCSTCCKPCSSGCHSILCYTHTENTDEGATPTVLENTRNYRPYAHALRPNTRFKTLFISKTRLIRGEHLDGRFTHQLRHLMWFKWDRGRWGCEYMCGGCGCVSGPCVNVRVYLLTLMKMLGFCISLIFYHCILYYLHNNVREKMNLLHEQNLTIMFSEMFQRASWASTEEHQTICTKSQWSMIKVTHLISHIETVQNIQNASFYSFQIPKTLFPISSVHF